MNAPFDPFLTPDEPKLRQLLTAASIRLRERFDVRYGRALLAMKIARAQEERTGRMALNEKQRFTNPLMSKRFSAVQSTSFRLLSLALCMSAVGAAFVYMRTSADIPSQSVGTSASVVYTTEYGRRETILLPDGSTVRLNAGSRLEVPLRFGQQHRTVHLQGHAVFSVNPSASIPFLVTARHTSTRVLGTDFSVRAYLEDPLVRVAVREGRVEVGGGVVSADDVALISVDGTLQVLRHQNIARDFAFTSDHLILIDASFDDAIREIERWYNVRIETDSSIVQPGLVNMTFTGASVTDLADLLQRLFDVRVTRIGRVLQLDAH